MDKKKNIHLCARQETHFSFKDTHRFKAKGWKGYPCKWQPKKAGVATLISDKVDFKSETVYRQRSLIKVNSTGRYSSCKYICTQHHSTYVYKLILTHMKGEISKTIMVDFSISLSIMKEHPDRKSIKKQWIWTK